MGPAANVSRYASITVTTPLAKSRSTCMTTISCSAHMATSVSPEAVTCKSVGFLYHLLSPAFKFYSG